MTQLSYKLAPGTIVGSRPVSKRSEAADSASPVPPLIHITDEIANAAALVAEADAAADGEPSQRVNKRSTFWMENIDRKGSWPWGNDTSYKVRGPHSSISLLLWCRECSPANLTKVFRNVKDYGAVGDGKKASHCLFLSTASIFAKFLRLSAGRHGSDHEGDARRQSMWRWLQRSHGH